MTDKLPGTVKTGDRVRVTFEGVVKRELMSTGMSILMDGATESQTFFHNEATADTFHIERIEKQIGVGDRVKDIAFGFGEGEILAMDGRTAFVRWDMKKYEAASTYLSNLERLS